MAISQTVVILAGGTAVLSISSGIRRGVGSGQIRRPGCRWRHRAATFDPSRLPGGGSGLRGGRSVPGPGCACFPPLSGRRRARGARLRHDHHGHAAISGRWHQHSADPADDGAGCRRHLSANQEPALSGIDPDLPWPGSRGAKLLGHRARRAAAMGHQYRRHRGGRALSRTKVRRCVSSLQGAGAAVGLMVGRGPESRATLQRQ
jgi:hypothetical protein